MTEQTLKEHAVEAGRTAAATSPIAASLHEWFIALAEILLLLTVEFWVRQHIFAGARHYMYLQRKSDDGKILVNKTYHIPLVSARLLLDECFDLLTTDAELTSSFTEKIQSSFKGLEPLLSEQNL